MIRSSLAPLVAGLLIAAAGCAREAGSEPATPDAPPVQPPPGAYAPSVGPPSQAGVPAQTWDGPPRKPKRLRDAGSTSPSATTTASAAAPAVSPSATASATPPAELFRAQDACLERCDQFACMKIAEAYKAGSGVPADPLAGRRYAIHACLECGTPGLAIVDQCPSWGITDEKKKK